MASGLEGLSAKEYPGRVIILGRDASGKNEVVVYAITGRSVSSQARKLEQKGNAIWAKPIDEELIKKGNLELLIYPTILLSRGIAVSNGKQTEDIKENLSQSQDPAEVLAFALARWDYEPDSPAYTPRISGCILAQRKAALSIIRRGAHGASEKNIFDVPLEAGKGKMISTYEGKNKDPLPSFEGSPLDVRIIGKNPKEMAEAVLVALAPRSGQKDYRVAVACVFARDLIRDAYDISIINRQERI